MTHEYSKDELLHKAAAFCSTCEHCSSEVEEKLTKWGASEVIQKEIINYLTKENYLNHSRFCSFFVKDKFKFNKWGKTKIAYALKSKQVEPELIAEALNSIDEDDYLDLLVSLLKTKLRGLKFNSEYEKRGKLIRFALSRGFENRVIDTALKALNVTEE
jgi:regulatory protein